MARPFEILIFEDNAPDVFFVRTALEESGLAFKLEVCRDGEEGLKKIRSIEQDLASCPDLLLLDLNLPRYSGEKLLEELRRTDKGRAVAVVVMTSSDSPRDRERAGALGVDHYFQKPPDLDKFMVLGEVVKNLLMRVAKPPRS